MTSLKKGLGFTLILMISLALGACRYKSSPPDERFLDQVSSGPASYQGIVERASVSAYSQGTHRIIAQNGAHLIQSSSINLNAYLDKEVLVSGQLQKAMGRAESILNVEEVSLTQISFEAPLKKYTSTRHDFILKHPETWEVGVTELGLILNFNQETWASINVYNNEAELKAFVSRQEDRQGTELTVAHQRALRFNDADSFRVYVEHPPSQRIYRLRFEQSHFSDAKKQPLFYQLLQNFELVYAPTLKGALCGGVDTLGCEEGYRCERSSAYSDAEGVCVPLTGGGLAKTCPYIAPPKSCPEYRVEEYNSNGCPLRYECLEESVSAPEALEAPEPSAPLDQEEAPKMKEKEAGPDTGDSLEYNVPPVDSVTGEYTSHSGLSIKYPKSWYFYNFGAQGIGFAPTALESAEGAVMVLKEGSGDLTREVEGKTYGISGPDDLKAVMQAILDSVE